MDWILLILIFFGFVILVSLCVTAVIVWWNMVYKYKFEIYEDISGKGYERTRVVRGRKLSIKSSLGDAVYWIPSMKDYVSAHGRKMGKNLYWYYVGPDGWLYNFVLGELDTINGILDIEPIDKNVRAFHTTNQRVINERYKVPTNWPTVIMSITIILAIIILSASTYLGHKEDIKNSEIQAKIGEDMKVITGNMKDLVIASNNIKQGAPSGGLAPAPGP